MTPVGYFRCECGAITILAAGGADYSVSKTNFRRFFPTLDLTRITRYKKTCNCNHCVNHYGLDLCGCGSGEEFGKCTNGLEECAIPMQVIGKYTKVVAKDAIGA